MSAPDLHGIAANAGIVDPFGAVASIVKHETYGRILNAISAGHTAGYNAGYAEAVRLVNVEQPDEESGPTDDELIELYLRGCLAEIKSIPDIQPQIVEVAMRSVNEHIPEPAGLRAIYEMRG